MQMFQSPKERLQTSLIGGNKQTLDLCFNPQRGGYKLYIVNTIIEIIKVSIPKGEATNSGKSYSALVRGIRVSIPKGEATNVPSKKQVETSAIAFQSPKGRIQTYVLNFFVFFFNCFNPQRGGYKLKLIESKNSKDFSCFNPQRGGYKQSYLI